MIGKIQKIREEVEKLHGNPYYMMAVKDVLAIIDSLQEEHVSEDLEKASYYFAYKCRPLKTEYSTTSPNPDVIEAFKAGAKWQKQQDQSTIELAEDHAMLAGMNKMEEQMMAKAIDGEVITTSDYGWENIRVHKKEHHCGQKVKVIVIKED